MTAVCLSVASTQAYDAEVVHRHMTAEAMLRANGSSGFLERIGLTTVTPLKRRTIKQLFEDGAVAEDAGKRPLNHFYDPVHESALVAESPEYGCVEVSAYSGQVNARQWAMLQNVNEFGMGTAKRAYIGALMSPSADARQQNEIALFTALGHMMHLVEDMAQPQHTRNDAHPTSDGGGPAWIDSLGLWSRYENWCRDHVTQSMYAGYPTVKLSTYNDYFNSGDGRGIAEFSNSNFVTEHTNYSDRSCPGFQFAQPDRNLATPRLYSHLVPLTVFEPDGTVVTQDVTYDDTVLSYPVHDAYTNATTVNDNHTYYSVLDYDLGQMQHAQPVYSLPAPAPALAAQAELLVPRAVGYAAGFLSHFFRGSIDASWKKNPDHTFKLVVTNTSAEFLFDGHLTVAYVPQTGTSTLIPEVDQDLPGVFGPGDSATFDHLTIPGFKATDDAGDFEQRLLVVGTLGTEQGAVIGLVQPDGPPPGYSRIKFEVSCEGSCNDYSFWVRRLYGYTQGFFIQDGVGYSHTIDPHTKVNEPSGSGGSGTVTIDFIRGSDVFYPYAEQKSCSNTFVNVNVTLDRKHYANWRQEMISNNGGFYGHCQADFPYFFY